MIALALLLAACPPDMPPDLDPRACAAVDACVRELAAQPDPETPGATGLVRDYLLAAFRFERCALAGYSLAIARQDTVQTLTSTPAAALSCPPAECSTELFSAALAGVAGCTLCGGLAQLRCGGP